MKKMTFIRWGELNPIKHKESRKLDPDKKYAVGSYDGYHVAPSFKGVYAFPVGYVEEFLLSSPRFDESRTWLKDDDGNRIRSEEFWEWDSTRDCMHIFPKYKGLIKKMGLTSKMLTDVYDREADECFMRYTRMKVKKFNYDGEIWHHLSDYVDHKDILESKGGWIKTDINVYAKALERCSMNDRFYSYQQFSSKGDPHTFPLKCGKDHYEVFIEKIK